MIDVGLLVSMVAAIGVPTLALRWWPLRTAAGGSFADLAALAALAGLIVGRLVNVALDAPGSFGRIGDLLIIRSGVEFWPGALVAALIVGFEAHRQGVGVLDRAADLAPPAMLGYAAYEACCVFRDGCYGPASPIGLRPPGVATTMLPVGLLVAVVIVAAAVVLRRWADAGAQPVLVVVGAVASLAVVRAVASIWLPHVGDGLTRPHQTSIVVAVLSVLVVAGLSVSAWRQRAAGPDAAADATSSTS